MYLRYDVRTHTYMVGNFREGLKPQKLSSTCKELSGTRRRQRHKAESESNRYHKRLAWVLQLQQELIDIATSDIDLIQEVWLQG